MMGSGKENKRKKENKKKDEDFIIRVGRAPMRTVSFNVRMLKVLLSCLVTCMFYGPLH